jgi:tight adherence protein C
MTGLDSISIVAFVMGVSLVLFLFFLIGGKKSRLDQRLDQLSGEEPQDQITLEPVAEFARTALPKMGATLVPHSEEGRTKLQTRLLHAGLYGRQAMAIFLGFKMLLMVSPTLLGLAAATLGLCTVGQGLIFGGLLSVLGMIGPSFWLDQRKRTRQLSFRRALPDALDVMVICLEGGLSLPGAIRRLVGEMRTAHPLLSSELTIVQREVEMGRSTGDALRHFAERGDLEELRSLASVIQQSEKFGASLVKALRVHADTLREKRLLLAEERAQKAATKILFPTLLFIFPAIFLVVLGPAAIQLFRMFMQLKQQQ